MPEIGIPELLIIFAIMLVLFGAGRVAELGGALGRGIREFRRALRGEAEGEDGPQAGPPDSV
jgi:sec-independent protein translocase protein TatA